MILNRSKPVFDWTIASVSEVREILTWYSNKVRNSNLELQMASSGYYHCKTGCEKSMENLPEMQNQLNNAPASFHGNLIRFKKDGTYHYMSTRNNAFSNRAQKADITVINDN